ncbi:MAG: transporter related [Verrucomicrobiaceae bacterium]|nr:transporter related [Verrucomicrobiaceae bacterium]
MRVNSLEVSRGEAVALVGPSGAGKTTLLRLVAGIFEPASGGMMFDGEDLRAMTPQARRQMRLTRVGVVFQDFALMDYLTVEENLLLPLRLGAGAKADHETRARAFADRLEVGRYWNKLARELSQGEQQRVAIARALIHEPTLVLADEPTASLDGSRKMIAARLMLNDARERGATLLMVTHDPELLPLFDRVVSLEELAR